MSELVLDPEIQKDILRTGLVILAGKSAGKSVAAKWLASQILQKKILSDMDVRVKITDSCQNWIHSFDPIPSQIVTKETRYLRGIDENEPNMLYDLEFNDTESAIQIIQKLLLHDLTVNREKKMVGKLNYWTFYVIEEAQNIIGRYALTGRKGEFWLKIISEGRNFNISFILIGQRAADISAQAIERAQGYLLGRMTGDNDRAKVKRICGSNSGIDEDITKLKSGEFIYYNGAKSWEIKFPLYEPKTKPILVGIGGEVYCRERLT